MTIVLAGVFPFPLVDFEVAICMKSREVFNTCEEGGVEGVGESRVIDACPSKHIRRNPSSDSPDLGSVTTQPPSLVRVRSPTPRYDSRRTVLTLRRNGLGGWRGKFAMIPSHLPNREDIRVLPVSPSVRL